MQAAEHELCSFPATGKEKKKKAPFSTIHPPGEESCP